MTESLHCIEKLVEERNFKKRAETLLRNRTEEGMFLFFSHYKSVTIYISSRHFIPCKL